jgi:hypothetical protein
MDWEVTAMAVLKELSKESAGYSFGHREAHCGTYPDDENYWRHFIELRSGLATVTISDDKAGVLLLDGPGRREAARRERKLDCEQTGLTI